MFKLHGKSLSKSVTSDGAADTGTKQQFHTTQCTRNSGHARAPDKKRAAAVTPASQTGEGRNTRTKTTAAESVADEKRHARNERHRHHQRHPWSEGRPVPLLKCPLTNARTSKICRVDLSPLPNSKHGFFFNCATSVSKGQGRSSWSLWNVQVRNFFCTQHMAPNEHKTSEAAALMLEIGRAQVIEAQVIAVFSPKRITARAGDPGLRPGFQIDLCSTKPCQTRDTIGT